MKLFLISFVVFALAMLGMAIGVIVRKRCLRGSCGGLAGLKDSEGRSLCDSCTTPSEECTGRNDSSSVSTDPTAGQSDNPRSFSKTPTHD